MRRATSSRGGGKTKSDSAGETLKIKNTLEFLANFAAYNRLLEEVCDSAEASFDGFALDERAEHPGTQQARAHAGDGDVERGDEGYRAARAAVFREDGRKQFEIADGNGVEDESVLLFVVAYAVEMS